LIAILTVISLLKGSGTDSLIGVVRCDAVDWTLFAVLQVICIIFNVLGIVLIKREYAEKVECGYEFVPGDLEATPRQLFLLTVFSFLGALIAAFCGVGPGMIFVPVLILIGIEAQVATATGMYITMFTTLSSSIQVIIFKKMDLQYALYLQIMTTLGSLPGNFFQSYMVRTTGRVSYQVFIFIFCIFFAMTF